MEPYELVELEAWANNRALSTRSHVAEGRFNVWGNSFPAEELPEPGSVVRVGGIPFRFASRGASDNVRCEGQLLALPAARYDWLYLLVTAERRTEDSVYLHFVDGAVDPEWLRVSSFWPETPPWFGERWALGCKSMHYPRHVQAGFGPTIWRGRIPVTRETSVSSVRLPDNPAIHIFAITALRATVGLDE